MDVNLLQLGTHIENIEHRFFCVYNALKNILCLSQIYLIQYVCEKVQMISIRRIQYSFVQGLCKTKWHLVRQNNQCGNLRKNSLGKYYYFLMPPPCSKPLAP